jgi:mRNA-degrading endonuclease RelE of RelBE toxin-antitoxin system
VAADPWAVEFARSAQRELERLEQQERHRVVEAIERLAAGDARSDVKRLRGQRVASYRLRVGELRVIFDRDAATRTLRVLAVRTRGSAYR